MGMRRRASANKRGARLPVPLPTFRMNSRHPWSARRCSNVVCRICCAQAFFSTAAAFLGLSLYGYTTKRDLSGIGTFLIMGVVGIFVALLLNMFLRSPALNLAISAIGVLVFAGLTAYDTQKIKSIYFAVAGNGEAMAKTAVIGALNLYLDFINMFLFLLRLFGDRR